MNVYKSRLCMTKEVPISPVKFSLVTAELKKMDVDFVPVVL